MELPERLPAAGIQLLADLEKAGAITKNGLVLPDDLAWDEYEALALMLGQLHRTSQWLIGDLINFGEKVYGETYVEAARLTGLADQTLMNISSVAARIPRSKRRLTLPFSVHAEVAYMEPDERERWLDKAEHEKLTRNELRLAIRGEPQIAPPGELLPTAGREISTQLICPACGTVAPVNEFPVAQQ